MTDFFIDTVDSRNRFPAFRTCRVFHIHVKKIKIINNHANTEGSSPVIRAIAVTIPATITIIDLSLNNLLFIYLYSSIRSLIPQYYCSKMLVGIPRCRFSIIKFLSLSKYNGLFKSSSAVSTRGSSCASRAGDQ